MSSNSVLFERNEKERVKEERNRRETVYSLVRLVEKKRREKTEAWVPLKIYFFSTKSEETRWSLLWFLLYPFLCAANFPVSCPPTFLFLCHCLPHSSSKFGDGHATSLYISFLDLYSTTSRPDLKTTWVLILVQYRWIYQ